MATITVAHGGDLEYIFETTHGGGLPTNGSLQIPSDSVTNIELQIAANVERHKTVSDYDCVDTSYHMREWTLTFEYKLMQHKAAGSHQIAKSLEYYALTRTSGDLTSLAFVYETRGTAYLLKGAKINTQSFGLAVNSAVPVSCEVWGTTVEVETAASTFTNYSALTPSQAVGGTFEIYGGAAITRSGAWGNGITDATLTINNNLERIPKVGSQDAIGVYPQNEDITLACTIIADTGGKDTVDDLMNADETSIVIASGATPGAVTKSMKWTLTKPSYNRVPVVYAIDSSHMKIAADLGAEAIALGAYT